MRNMPRHGVLSLFLMFISSTTCIASAGQEGASAPLAPTDGMVRGITRCANDLTLGFPITGRIAVVKVKEGSEVKPKELLMHLDQEAERLEVERRHLAWQSKAELTAAEARVKTLHEQARSARQIHEASRGVSLEEVQGKELSHSLAKAEVERLRVAEDLERLDYLIARENLERRSLRAPTTGIITKLLKHAGENVQANEPAIKMCDMSSILFTANVPLDQLGDLAAGKKVEVEVGSERRTVMGKVEFVSPVIDPASGLCEVKVALEGSGGGMRPGMPARLRLGGSGP